MTTAAASPPSESNKSKVRRNLFLLFGCGIRSKSPEKESDAGLTRSLATNTKPTVEDGIQKQPEEHKAVGAPPPSPDKTEATEDISVHSMDEVPNMDDPATTRSTSTGNDVSGAFSTGNSSRSGGSAMERNIARVLFSFLFTILTLGMVGRSDSKKAITADGEKSSAAATTASGSKKKQEK